MGLTKTQVSQLYVVLLGRASEGGGNAYWQTDTSGQDLAAAADTMFAVGAVQSYFGSSLDTSRAFIEKIYADTLGRTYDQDPEGIDYWIDELDNGRTKGQVAASLIMAVQEEANSGPAQDRFNNRVMVSDYTADHIEEFSASIGFSDFISQVTDDTATVSRAMADVDMAADLVNTQSLTLTTGADAITGSHGDDRIMGSDETYNANDTIDGGSGEDSLTLFLFSGVTDRVAVSGVEEIIIRNGYDDLELDGSGWAGVDLLSFSGSTADTAVDQVQDYLDLGMKNNEQGVVLTYGDDALKSEGAAQKVSVRDSAGSISIRTGGEDRITSLHIDTAGTSSLAIEENDITDITITGWGTLELLSTADSGTLVQVSAIEASSATADLILDMSGVDMSVQSGNLVSVTGGAGDDIITASGYDNLIFGNTGNDTIIVASGFDDDDLLLGGSGYDTLALASADALAAASDPNILDSIQGFEAVGFRDALDMDQAFDLSVFGVNSAVIQAGLSGDETLEGFGADAVVEIQTDASETDVLTITMDGASEAGSNDDRLDIRFNADLEAGDGVYESVFDVKGINVISVTTADSSIVGESVSAENLPGPDEGYRLTLVSDHNVNTISVSGDQSFYYTAGVNSGLETLETGNMTGDMTLDFNTAFGGTQGVTLTAGQGSDTLTGSVYGDVILAGAGDDTIYVTTGADRITGGTGADVFVVGSADISTQQVYTAIADFSAVSDTAVADTITNVAGTITGDVSALDVSGASGGAAVTADVANGILTLGGPDAAKINTYSEWLQVAYLACESGKTIGFEYGTNTYILEEAAAGDTAASLLELTGVVSVAALSSSAGVDTVIISI